MGIHVKRLFLTLVIAGVMGFAATAAQADPVTFSTLALSRARVVPGAALTLSPFWGAWVMPL